MAHPINNWIPDYFREHEYYFCNMHPLMLHLASEPERWVCGSAFKFKLGYMFILIYPNDQVVSLAYFRLHSRYFVAKDLFYGLAEEAQEVKRAVRSIMPLMGQFLEDYPNYKFDTNFESPYIDLSARIEV